MQPLYKVGLIDLGFDLTNDYKERSSGRFHLARAKINKENNRRLYIPISRV